MGDPLGKLRIGLSQFRKFLQKCQKAYLCAENGRKKNIYLGTLVLALGVGIFFNAFFDPSARAERNEPSGLIAPQALDPWNRIGRGMQLAPGGAAQNIRGDDGQPAKNSLSETRLATMLAGHPMAAMIPALVKEDKATASFLVSIAKKESDWGLHTPKKNGRECYNLWGYRGAENPTLSGYSCFDSPEQAVKVVGARISKLLSQKINTPERMVVWKCGGDCDAAGGQAAANKWIADVAFIYNKLRS
jgi:hypothetical protein